MIGNLRWRYTVIAVVVGFLAYMAYTGVVEQKLEMGIDLKGGSELIFRFDFEDSANKQALLTEAIGVIQDRVDGYGLKDIVLQPIGTDRFAVQISAKDKEKVDAIKSLITDLGKLEFRITVEPGASDNYDHYWKLFQDALKKGIPEDKARWISTDDLKEEDRGRFANGLRWYQLSDRAIERRNLIPRSKSAEGGLPYVLCQLDAYDISGDALYNVVHARDTRGLSAGWVVYFRVKKLNQAQMAQLTAHEQDKYMAIILNGQVDSAPILKSTLSDQGEISGSFSEQEARSLAAILQAGALQKKPELLSERTIAPDLAGSARDKGILSVLIGFVLVLGLMVWLYAGPGLLANLALLLNLVLLVGVLTWFDAVLTLPGLAGVVLTVGMAVDANILVFERIKEEKSRGRTIVQAIATGYDRALVTIVDANLTTLITAYFLFQIGSGPVRGFGITLAVGIVASMFTALYVTRTLFASLIKRGKVTEARMRGEFVPPTIGWMAMTRKAVLASAIAMIVGVSLWEFIPDKAKYDLDFTQGSKLIMRFAVDRPVDEVRKRIDKLGESNALYREVAVRMSAEGIGATVGSDAGRGFELRSQAVASQAQIEEFKDDLRTEFKDDLLPGPFVTTLTDQGGGSVGDIYFLNAAVTAPLLQEALNQYKAKTDRLPAVTVAPAAKRPGIGAAFRLTFADRVTNPGQTQLNVRTAFETFDIKTAIADLETTAKDENKTQTEQQQAAAAAEALKGFAPEQVTKAFFEEADPFPLADRIDPSTAQEHKDAAINAVALSILGIIMYVAFRFRSWSYGFAAVIALIHDVLITLGLVALVSWLGIVDARLNLVTVAAFLTLIGYSINDSIVVFDRIRENRGTGRARMREIIDESINQTFTRTIRTTSTTWVVVIVLLLMNLGANSSLEGFAFVLTIGVLVGTYSSIFIASPTLLYLPWLWEKCGSSVGSFAKRCIPWWIASTAALIGIDALEGRIDWSHDFSVPLFNDIMLGIPVGVLALFLVNFVRFTSQETGEASPAS